MSVHWIDRVWKLSEQKGSQLLLMLAIADSANDDGLAYPGHAHLAEKTRLSARHVITLIEHAEQAGEIVTEVGGQGAKDTNQYVILLGREPAEIELITGLIKAGKSARFALAQVDKREKISPLTRGKREKISPLSDVKDEKISPLRVKKKANKGEVASSPEPLTMDGTAGWMDEWMKSDLVCQFLIALPGYNPSNLRKDRAAIDAKAYNAEALQYLWEDCEAGADNPIGLFLYRTGLNMQSPRYAELAQRQRDEESRQRAEEERRQASRAVPVTPFVSTTAPEATVFVPDPSIMQPLPNIGTQMTPVQVWQAAQGELQLQMTRATYDTWVKPADVISVNGSWQIGVPNQYSQEWWETRLKTTLQRILHGIVGQPCEVKFLVIQRGSM